LVCDDGLVIMGDESELREVLVNLVFNAVDAMPSGGTLTMAAKASGDVGEMSVQDTGIGMTEETRLRGFDPFFTAKETVGVGRGLAVSYGIIRRHEATVDVLSQLGLGSTFRLRFPPARDVAKAQLSLSLLPSKGSLTASQTKILVVDDEELVRNLLRDILNHEGCEAVVARGGDQALSLFEKGEFDAVFTDVGMSGMNGWELSRSIRQRNKKIPIAIITGWGEAVGSHERLAAKVDWVVTKPFDTSQIAEVAQEVLRRKALLSSAAVAAAA